VGGAQTHDFNPGITQNGLFWTAVLEPRNVEVNLNAGTAKLEVYDLHLKDYGDFENSITGYAGPPAPAIVSFRVQWSATGAVHNFNNAAQQFRGAFRDATARMEFTARVGKLDITSAPLAQSTTVAAEMGQESNGSFY
jgi:hypothetical protein